MGRVARNVGYLGHPGFKRMLAEVLPQSVDELAFALGHHALDGA